VSGRRLASIAFVLATGCNASDGRTVYPHFDQTILDLAKAEPELSTWVRLVTLAGLDAALGSDDSTYTAFAPQDSAFAALPAGMLSALEADPTTLAAVLSFQIAPGDQKTNLLLLEPSVPTITATAIEVSSDGSNVTLIDHFGTKAHLTKSDQQGSNGILQVIDAVLAPPPMPAMSLGSVLDVLNAAGNFSSFLQLVDRAGLNDQLSMTAPITVFAPNDAALAAFASLSQAATPILQNLVLQHVVSGSVAVAALAANPNPALSSLDGLPLAVVGTTTVTVGGATLADTIDLLADNGIGHALAGVIPLPSSLDLLRAHGIPGLAATATAAARIDATLLSLLDPDTFGGAQPMTLFLPNDAAWRLAMISTATVATATLSAILHRHAVVGQVLVADLKDGETLVTLSGTVAVHVDAQGPSLDDGRQHVVRIIPASSDVRTKTGALHVVDGLLGP
jgi:uncharacterized surface protein with fasciclin (FAS1) repeats